MEPAIYFEDRGGGAESWTTCLVSVALIPTAPTAANVGQEI